MTPAKHLIEPFISQNTEPSYALSEKDLETSGLMQEATQERPFNSTVKEIKRIDGLGDKETYLVSLRVNESWSFEPGKAIGVIVKNCDELVQRAKSKYHTSHPNMTLHNLDLTGQPKHHLLNRLGIEAEDIKGYGLIDMNCEDILVSEFGHLAPRYYSICNSPLAQPGVVQFVFNVSEIRNAEGELIRLGAGSSFLRQLKKGDKLPIFPRAIDSGFKLPPAEQLTPTTPLIMVCAGTGVAPFIGFLQHLEHTRLTPETHLFFGVRNSDYIFKDQLSEFERKGVLRRLVLATSREAPQQYVQDVIDGEWLYEKMSGNPLARIYICGDEMTMVKAVNTLIQQTCEKHGNSKLIHEWSKAKRILRDIWI